MDKLLSLFRRRPERTPNGNNLLSVLRAVNEQQGDLSLHMQERGNPHQLESARLFNQFMERLRVALEDITDCP